MKKTFYILSSILILSFFVVSLANFVNIPLLSSGMFLYYLLITQIIFSILLSIVGVILLIKARRNNQSIIGYFIYIVLMIVCTVLISLAGIFLSQIH